MQDHPMAIWHALEDPMIFLTWLALFAVTGMLPLAYRALLALHVEPTPQRVVVRDDARRRRLSRYHQD